MRRTGIRGVSLVVLMLTIVGSFARAAQVEDDDKFLQFVADVGFGGGAGNPAKNYLLKWKKPMAVDLYFSQETPSEVVTSISNAFSEAQTASGLPMRFY